MRTEMLDRLREHFNNTPLELLQEEWKQVEQMGFGGPKAYEYVDFLCKFYSPPVTSSCLPDNICIPKNITSNFSGYFFFRNIAI